MVRVAAAKRGVTQGEWIEEAILEKAERQLEEARRGEENEGGKGAVHECGDRHPAQEIGIRAVGLLPPTCDIGEGSEN